MALKKLISVDDLSLSQIETVFRLADRMRAQREGHKTCINEEHMFSRGRVAVANLFYEPSTRTAASFHVAACRLGASVFSVDDVKFSSLAKGESLEDTIRVVGSYVDAIVIRHPNHDAVVKAAALSPVPIINAGSGGVEHPTQALLDLYTIKRRLGFLQYINVGLMGDLKNGRTVHSLVKLLRHYDHRLHLISPDELQLPAKYLESGRDVEHWELDECIEQLDVLYMTRVQWERLSDKAQYKMNFQYGVTEEHMRRAKAGMLLMHPLPRLSELPRSLDDDPRSVYFEQAENGLYVRMALLWAMMRGMV